MDEAPPTEGGLFTSVTRVCRTLRALIENRLEVFLIELKEERILLFDALLLLATGIVFALMALAVATLTVVVIFWDTHRLLVLILLTLAYAGAAVVAVLKLRSRLQHWQSFAVTLEQFKKDQACLEQKN